MKLNYNELKSYYDNGLLTDILAKRHLSAEDFAEELFSYISVLEDEIHEQELTSIRDSEDCDKKDSEIFELKSKVNDLEEELEALREVS